MHGWTCSSGLEWHSPSSASLHASVWSRTGRSPEHEFYSLTYKTSNFNDCVVGFTYLRTSGQMGADVVP
eukprot:5688771-Amphidinium_carterae.1